MKLLIAIPCMDMVHAAFCRSLVGLRLVADEVEFRFSQNSLIYDSRNQIAEYAIKNGFDFVLWLDSDMVFQADMLDRMYQDINFYGIDFICGLYTTRKKKISPCIYTDIKPYGKRGLPEAPAFFDYPKDTVFEIAGCGFGAVFMKTTLLKDVMEQFGYMFSPVVGMGEDLSFCYRASALGHKMYCDSGIKLGHMGQWEFSESMIEENK